MSQYIPFTDEQKLRAGDVDLEEFLLRRGEKLIVSGQEKRMASDHSMSWFETIYADTELSHRALSVYMYLRDRSDKERKCWPGLNTIAADLHLSRSTVKRAIADLEKAGYLQKAHRNRDNGGCTSNVYTIIEKARPP